MRLFLSTIFCLVIGLTPFLVGRPITSILAQGPGGQGDSSLYLPLVSKITSWDIAVNQFGYALRDSSSDRDLQFNWEEIADSGTEILHWLNMAHEIPIGFYFPFYDGEYNTVTVTSYGKIQFNTTFPGELGAFRKHGGWMTSGRVYYEHRTNPHRLIIEFHNIQFSDDAGPSDFQIILYQSGDILLQYRHVSLADSKRFIGTQYKVFAKAPTPNSRLLFAGGDALYRTVNGGRSWALAWKPEGLRIRDIAFSPDFTRDHTLYLAGDSNAAENKGNGFWISSDAGLSWHQSSSAARLSSPSRIHFSTDFPHTPKIWLESATNASLFLSTDGGETWQTISLPTSMYHLAVALNDAGEGDMVFLVDWSRGAEDVRLWVSADDGFHWTEQSRLPVGVTTLIPAADYPETNALYAMGYTYSAAIFRSTDHGNTWEAFDEGMPSHQGYVVTMAEHASTHTLFALWAGRSGGVSLYRREPNDIWRLVSSSAPSGLAINQAGYILNETNTLTVFASSAMTRDEGHTWIPYPSDLSFQSVLVSPTFVQDSKAWGWTRSSLMMTEDGGTTWQQVGSWQPPTGNIGVHPLAVSPSFDEDSRVFAGSSEGIFRSEDGGKTWMRVNANRGVNHLAISPDFGSDGVIFSNMGYSLNGGETWTFRELGAVRVSPDYAKDHSIYRISVSEGAPLLEQSVDLGQTWQSIRLPQSMEAGYPAYDLVLAPCLSQYPSMFIGKEDGWGGSSWLSDDGGHSWRWFGAGKFGSSNSHQQAYFYVPVIGRLYHLNDEGLWWSQLDWPASSDCAATTQVILVPPFHLPMASPH